MDLATVEGVNGVGKTTYIRELMKIQKDWNYFPELSETNTHLPKFSLDPAEVIKQNEWFLKEEYKRHKKILKLSKNKKIICDRWLFSTLAFCYARRKIYNTEDKKQLVFLIKKTFGEKFVAPIPIFILYKGSIIERIKKRVGAKKENCLNEPYSEEFYQNMQNYFKLVSKNLGKRCKLIKTSKPQIKIERKIFRYLEKRKFVEINVGEIVL